MKQSGLAPILIVVLVAILGVGGYFWFSYSNNQTKPAQNVQTTKTPAPATKPESTSSAASPAPNGAGETANWKTYTSKNNGYTVKYPASWETYGYSRTPNDDADIVGERFFRPIGQKDDGFAITIRTTLSKETNYVQTENFIKGFFDDGRKISSIQVDGVNGTKVEGQTKGQKQIIAIFTNNKTVVEIQSGFLDGVEIFDQILTTFKFTQ